jgi:hypothetical protein
MDWATFWVIFSEKHLVTLIFSYFQGCRSEIKVTDKAIKICFASLSRSRTIFPILGSFQP